MAEDNTNTTAKKRVSIAAPENAPSRRGGRGGKFMKIHYYDCCCKHMICLNSLL